MTSKQKQLHSHIFTIENCTITLAFDDKRTLNSLVKALEKAKSMNIAVNSVETETKVETPHTFDGWSIVEKYDHIALQPPECHNKEIITLMPDLSVEWNPTLSGKYWNDGLYHFFPKRTKYTL